MKQPNFFTIIAFGVIALILAWLGYQRFRHPNISLPKENSKQAETLKHSIPLDEIFDGGPGKDGIPSIDSPRFISAAEAKSEFKPEGLGLAVSLNGEARFYPYQILVWHELVNDQIGQTPVLVSFCPLCGSGLVFERTINGEAVEFGVSGKLHNSDLLMYDRKTDSLWQQILGEAVVGELTGTQLKQLDASVIPFKTFAEKFSTGRVLSKDTGFVRDYNSGPYGDYDTSQRIIFPVGQKDARLHPKTRVLGVAINGKFKAYPLDAVQAKGRVSDTFANHQLDIDYNGGIVKIFDKTAQQAVVPVNNFWFAWFAFHPDTELYQ